MSDVADSDSPERTAEGRIEFEVRGTPGAPGPPRPFPSLQSNKISMGWTPPQDDGGSPITAYEVVELRKNRSITCRTNECDFGGLENAKAYRFKVRAINKVGKGDWSPISQSAFADTAPGRVDNIRMQSRGDHTITVAWSPPTTQTSKVLSYVVTWQGAQPQTVPGDQTSLVAGNLDNNTQYSFTVKALNRVNYSPPRTSEPFQSMGTPAPPGTPAVVDLESGVAQTSVRITWPATLPEGPGPTLYTRHLRDAVGDADRSGLLARPGHHLRALRHHLRRHHVRVHRQGAQPRQHLRAEPTGDVPGGGQTRELGCLVGRADRCRTSRRGWRPWHRNRGARRHASRSWWAAASSGRATWPQARRSPRSSPRRATARRTRCSSGCATSSPRRAGCTSSDVKTTQTYGPLRSSHIYSTTPVVEGKSIRWVIEGTSNGDAAIIDFQAEGGALQTIRLPGPGAFRIETTPVATTDYNQRQSMAFTLYDDAPAGRGEFRDGATAESGDPPPPTLNLYKGTACSDNDDDAAPDCQGNILDPACDGPTCARLALHHRGLDQQLLVHDLAELHVGLPGREQVLRLLRRGQDDGLVLRLRLRPAHLQVQQAGSDVRHQLVARPETPTPHSAPHRRGTTPMNRKRP